MSLSLITNPIASIDLQNPDVFPGFQPIEFKFKRIDDVIVDGFTLDIKVLFPQYYDRYKNFHIVFIDQDPNAVMSVGDYIFLYVKDGENVISGYFPVVLIGAVTSSSETPYDSIVLGEVRENPPNVGSFELADEAILNFLQDYYVEIDAGGLLGRNLKDYGNHEGIYTIDVSVINDLNELTFPESDGLISEMVTQYLVRYRQVYSGSSEGWTNIGTLYIVYATEDLVINQINHFLQKAIIVEGYYRSAVTIITSPTLAEGTTLTIQIIEYDNSQTQLAVTNVATLSISSGGIYYADFSGHKFQEDTFSIDINGIWS